MSAAGEQRLEQTLELRPVVSRDDAVGRDDRLVPGVAQRRRGDARVVGAGEIDRAVVDQQIDPDLAAAADLVHRQVEVVVGHADRREPVGRRRVGVRRAVARDVDVVAGLMPAVDDVDGTLVGLGGGDQVAAVGLLDEPLDLVGLQTVDPPRALRLVRQDHSEPLLGQRGELVPVVVKRGVDVDRDAHRRPRSVDERDGALRGAADERRVLREDAGAIGVRRRLVGGDAGRDLVVVEVDVDAPLVDVDRHGVAVADSRDRPAACRLRVRRGRP